MELASKDSPPLLIHNIATNLDLTPNSTIEHIFVDIDVANLELVKKINESNPTIVW